MLLRIQVQRAFRPSGWRGLPSCLQRVRSEQHVRAGSNSSETCQTCNTCGEQLCSTGSLQKALDQWCVGYKAMHHVYTVAQAGFLEGWQPLLIQSEVLGWLAPAMWPHTFLLRVNPEVLTSWMKFQTGKREKGKSSSDGPKEVTLYWPFVFATHGKARKITGCQEDKLENSNNLLEIHRDGSLETSTGRAGQGHVVTRAWRSRSEQDIASWIKNCTFFSAELFNERLDVAVSAVV